MHSTRCFPSRLRSSTRAHCSKSAYGRKVCTAGPYPAAAPLPGRSAPPAPTRDGRCRGRRGSAGGRALGVVVVAVLDPGHQLAQLAAGALDRVLLALGAQALELRRAGVLVVDE